jgi:putative ABC transport system permease protein
VFEDLVGYDGSRGILSNNGKTTHELQGGTAVTPNTFEFYGVPSLLGRVITAEDGMPGAPAVFVMNYKMWQTEFGGDPKILGTTFVLNGESRTLVGIMPRRFNIYDASIWTPVISSADSDTDTLQIVGRLKPGASLQAATADLDVIAHRLTKDENSVMNPEHYTIVAQTLIDVVLGNFKKVLYTLLAAVAMLLLIACTSVANLLLARATVREREMAMRSAFGATRARLIRQLLVESFVLSAAASGIGSGLAYFGLRLVVAVLPQGMLPREAVTGLNVAVLWFALGTTILTTFICGLAPALHAIRGDLQPRLTGSSKGASSSFRHGKFRAGLVISEVALSIVLLIGAGLMMRNFIGLTHTDLSFNPATMLYVRLDLPLDRYYGHPDRKPAFFQQVLPRIEALPGVISATESWMLPPNEGAWTDVAIPGEAHYERWTTDFELCTEGYFRTLGVQLLRGRLLLQADIDLARHVTVVNETLARQYFGKEDPIGQKIKFEVFDRPFLDAPHNAYFEIVGVVKDSKTRPERKQYMVRPDAFLPLSVVNLKSSPSILVKTAVDPHALLKSVQREVWAVDPEVACNTSGSIDDLLRGEFSVPRFEFIALSAFAGTGLVLVMIGIFSVIAYTVALQTHEIGVRMALGALPSNIKRMVLNQGAGLIGVGIVVGVLMSVGLTRFLATLLWGVSTTDPLTFVSVIAVLLAVGLAACFLPAQRASKVDPMVALRYE